MVDISFDPAFQRQISKIGDALIKVRILKQIEKIKNHPEAGKPMRGPRKGTRELKIPPFRLSYVYHALEEQIEILDFYHKDEQ